MQKAQEWLLSHNRYSRFLDGQGIEKKRIDGRAITIAFTGGKGGVGKTTMALRTAIDLSNQGFKVLLLDCDYNLSNTFVKLGLPIDDRFAVLCQGNIDLENAIYKKGNFHLIPGCNGNQKIYEDHKAEPDYIERLILGIISKTEYEYDFILLDTPAGIKKEIMELCAYCDHRVFVVTPDRSSITDSYSLIKILKNNYGIGHNCLLLNRIRDQKQFNRLVKCLTDTVDQFLSGTLSVLGKVSEVDCATEKFDQHFLNWEKSSIPQEFDQALLRLVDEVGASERRTLNGMPRKGINVAQADLSI